MDPVSVIVTALAGGAAAALKDTASQAIKDGYAGLKALVLRRLQKAQPNAEVVLAEFERDSETWEKPVRKSLADSAGDQELVEQAQRLLQLLQSEQGAPAKYSVQVSGDVRGQIIGDHGQQTNVFGKE